MAGLLPHLVVSQWFFTNPKEQEITYLYINTYLQSKTAQESDSPYLSRFKARRHPAVAVCDCCRDPLDHRLSEIVVRDSHPR